MEKLYDNWLWLYIQRFLDVQTTRRSSASLPDLSDFAQSGGFGIIPNEDFQVGLIFNSSAANYVHDRIWAKDQQMEIAGRRTAQTGDDCFQPQGNAFLGLKFWSKRLRAFSGVAEGGNCTGGARDSEAVQLRRNCRGPISLSSLMLCRLFHKPRRAV